MRVQREIYEILTEASVSIVKTEFEFARQRRQESIVHWEDFAVTKNTFGFQCINLKLLSEYCKHLKKYPWLW